MTVSPKLRTIIVDDDVEVAALHARFVAVHPAFEVVATAHSGPEALQLIEQNRPDLVLLDFDLPGLSGLDVLRGFRALGGHQPEVIAVTAARDVDSVRQARSAGIQHYLVKPFTAANLQARLEDVARDRLALLESLTNDGLAQRDIDALMRSGARGRVQPGRPAPLPKGLSAPTLETVEGALAGAPNSSAAEIATLSGLSRVSARRYLEYLVSVQRARKSLDYETAGRPSARFSVLR
ncbi:response regulator [Conyzicola nivalis]|uniref:Transcriptional regulatory protein n=1 Tax=Conyzicola nivalis TaxID=1477021 RepID=A0A916SJH7_9MICO|nr:response regulator [Conyzicola nivalis]GGB00708.1 transcriptional regulatory protein [Conyzicola nivalis]